MLLTKLNLNYFGRFHNREIELKPGINLIYGDNEAGKSTIHTFIKGMLFGIERMRGRAAASKEDLYIRYLPWDYPGAFGGQMDIRIDDKEYRIHRSFHANDKSFTITDLATGRELKLKEGLISELIPGLTETSFKNTISIEQLKAQTDAELASQVRNYITNLSIAKSKEVNVAKAVSSLTEQKKALEAALNSNLLKNLQVDIEEGLEREEKIDMLTIQLRTLLSEEQELLSRKEQLTASYDSEAIIKMEELPAVLEKYRTYCELLKQGHILAKQQEDLKEKIASWKNGCINSEILKEDLREAEQIRAELPLLQNSSLELLRNNEEAYRLRNRKSIIVSMLPSLAAAVLSYLFLPSDILRTIAAVCLPAAGVIVLMLLLGKVRKEMAVNNEKQEELRQKISKAENRRKEILQNHRVASVEELALKKEEAVKQAYSLEHGREQLSELIRRRTESEDKKDYLHDSIMQYMQYFITEEELTEDAVMRLKEIIRLRKLEISETQEKLNRQLETNRLQMEKLGWELNSMEGNEEQLLKNKELYAQTERKQAENSLELEAVKLALATIQELSADIHDSFGRQLNQAVSEIISEVTQKKYQDLKVDEKLGVKVGWKGDYILLERLSAGTVDQIYFALRLAVADLLLGKDKIPVILDDSFAMYDDNRVKAALKEIAERNQILLFSCHNREKRIMEEMKLPYHFVDLSCR